ncbi:retrovirus-related pol polyprotein from transposon TNT 1-94 [Tanacetum coccineum]
MLASPVVEREGSGQPYEPQPAPSTAQPRIEELIHVTDPGGNTPGSDEERIEQDDLTDFVPPTPHDSPLSEGHTPGSDEEGRKKQMKLWQRTAQDKPLKISTSKRKSLDEEYVSKQGRKCDKTKLMFDDSDFAELDVDNSLENVEVNTASIDVSAAEPSNVSTADPSTRAKTKNNSVIIHDVLKKIQEALKNPRKAQIQMDEELAIRLHEEEKAKLERMQRERAAQEEASNAALIAEFDNNGEKGQARFLVETIAERKRFFAAQRAEQIRNKPPTKIQLRNKMITYLKNMGRFTYNQLKNKSFEEIQKLYEKEQKWIKDFIPMDSEEGGKKAASSKKRPRAEPDEESVKRQKIGEASGSGEEQSAEKEKELSEEELQKLLVVVPVEEVYVEALQVKYPIIDWEVYSEDTRRYWRIIRVGNHTEAYQIFADMLKKFDRDDLVKLWDLVKKRFSTTEPTDDKEKELWVELKRLFEPDNDDILWKLQRYMHDPLVWRLYDTCGVHHVSLVRGHDIFMLVEKEYPLTRGTLGLMMVAKLLVEADSEMSRELLRKFFYQANRPRQSLPSSWSQVSLVMRTKPEVDNLSFDDHYNNLRVFESDVKGSTGSSSSAQNVAFVSSESISSTNDVSTAYDVSTSSGYKSQRENSSSYTDELMYSFFANQSSGPQLDHEDLEQLDEFDLEEIDLKWQVVMISMRLKKFYKKTGRRLKFDAKEPVGFDKTKEEPKALVTLNGEGVDWTSHAEDEQENFALMANSNSGSDTEALHPKWRAKVMAIKESKDLTSLSLELIRNLEVQEMIIKKDSKIVKAKGERISLALKAKKESSDKECSTSGSEDEEYAMAVRDFKKFFKEEEDSCGDPNHLIRECPKPPKDKNQKSFVRGSCSDSGEEDDEKVKNKMCLVAQASSEICLGVYLEPDEWIKDSGCSKHMTGNRKLFSSYKANNGGNVIFGKNLRGNIIGKGKICDNKCRVTFSEHDSEITKDGKVIGYSQNSKAYIILNKNTEKVKESLNVTFDKTPPPFKTSPLVDDDLDEEEAIKVTKKKNLENDIEDETLEIYDVVNIKESKNRPLENVIGNLNKKTLRSQAQNQSNFFCFISTIEPKNVNEALMDDSWIVAMQEELNQFIANEIWELVPQPKNMTIIETKWIFRNKLDENGIVSQNKARLVSQGYNQQEGIDYDETYAPVARLKSIMILLAYACALDFKLFQMDVKSAFLNGFINEEVYVAQPLGFIEFKKPDHVYELKNALYDLKQAPKAWYDRLKSFLIKHEYKMGMVDNTLFTKKKGSNLIIVQIYVDDIIFDSTCQDMCDEFAKIMHDEFEMSMVGELNFFLRLQIKQIEDGIFFNQSKYIKEMLKKFGLEESKPMKTPMSSDTKLTKDKECESLDSTKYQDMIGSLLYLTASRPDIMFSVCLCVRFQEAPKTSHLEVAKHIFRYIKGTMHLRLWYPKGIGIETVVYADSNHARDYVD